MEKCKAMSIDEFMGASLIDFALDKGNKQMLAELARGTFEIVKPGTSGFLTAVDHQRQAFSKSMKAWEEAERSINVKKLYTDIAGAELANTDEPFWAWDYQDEDYLFEFYIPVTDIRIENGMAGCYKVNNPKLIEKFTEVRTTGYGKQCNECGFYEIDEPSIQWSEYFRQDLCDHCHRDLNMEAGLDTWKSSND